MFLESEKGWKKGGKMGKNGEKGLTPCDGLLQYSKLHFEQPVK